MAGNDLNRGLSPDKSAITKRRRKLKASTTIFLTVLIVLIILVFIGIYVFFNDVKMPVVLDLL